MSSLDAAYSRGSAAQNAPPKAIPTTELEALLERFTQQIEQVELNHDRTERLVTRITGNAQEKSAPPAAQLVSSGHFGRFSALLSRMEAATADQAQAISALDKLV